MRDPAGVILGLISLVIPLLAACGGGETVPTSPEPSPPLVNYTEEREPCECRSEYRNLYWGDLHAHTVLSYDAYIWGAMVTPEEAYRFARGGTITLSPDDPETARDVRLSRPLDFVALTDHQEYLPETWLCTTEGSAAYDGELCQKIRAGGSAGLLAFSLNLRNDPASHMEEVCQSPGVDCREVSERIWEAIVRNAEDAYDRSSECTFTAFPAYEFTLSPALSNMHRNIIFRNAEVPASPPSGFDQSTEQGLWDELLKACLEAGDECDYIAIPHNSNWSNGHMFTGDYPEGMSLEEQRQEAATRVRNEPLVEIAQHKGCMECRNGFGTESYDPACDFEEIWEEGREECGPEPGSGAMAGGGCISRYDYIRNVLKLGLSEWLRLGVNPYKLGIIASTDTHNGIPGDTEEYDYIGHWGYVDDTPEDRLTYNPPTPSMALYNPGGLVAVWAVENSRDAIFESLRRRETYATTGPRITVRFFGGWDYPDGLCEDGDLVSTGYEKGVPMGGDLPVRPDGSGVPTFAIMAVKDPGVEGHPGTDLQQIQVIKGWIDAEGNEREAVYTVAGDPDNGANVSPETCEPAGEGRDQLCTVWTDPDFDPALPAFYYVRVIENPSCRWLQYDCDQFPEGDRPEVCTSPVIPKVVQEMAITSPIWYEPAG